MEHEGIKGYEVGFYTSEPLMDGLIQKKVAVKRMISEMLEECDPDFSTTKIFVHEKDGKLIVGIRWAGKNSL